MPPTSKSLKGKPHPLYIPSVVNQIMSSLSVADLLRARQVCRQWNEEASKYFRNRVKLKIYRSKELHTIQNILEKSKEMFCFPLEFKRVHLEAELRPSSSGGGAFDLFFSQFAPKLKTLSVKQSSWDTMFPLNRFTELEELTVYGNLNKHVGVFPRQVEPYLRNLRRAYFYLEGRITTDTAVEAFVINIATLLHSAPNLEEIIAPQKMDHRDETPESFRDLTANYIFLNLLCSEEATIRLPCLRSIHIDAKLEDRDLHSLGVAASKFPNVDTLRIALSGLATRRELIFVLESYADRLKKLAISYSKTHGHRMTLESFFLQDNPLKKLEYLSLKNYPASVVFVGAIRSLKEFRIEVRNIADCFPTDRDDFFLQPTPSNVSTRSDKTWKRRDGDAAVVQIDDSEPPTAKKMRTLRVDPSKAHGLTSFHYIHHKEGTQINLYGDRCPFTVTRRIAMRFPQLTRLTLDNMTGDSLTCVIKYLPLLEELHALGGFYNDLAITGASSKEELKDPDFPSKRKLPYIGDLKYVHTLSLSTFSKNSALWDTTDLLSKNSIYYGLMNCPNLRRLTLGNDERKISCTRAKFETSIGDKPLYDLIGKLNLTYLKTVRCPLTPPGFRRILRRLRQFGVEYSINSYQGPLLPEEFFRRNRQSKPVVQLKRLTVPISTLGVAVANTSTHVPVEQKQETYLLRSRGTISENMVRNSERLSESNSTSNGLTAKVEKTERKKRRKRRYGRY